MEPALDVLNRALQGDPGARSFLERTTSIYVLDVTDATKPKTYGCWNFIHQAMNEVERYESKFTQSNHAHALLNGAGLVPHVRLLATMALRVARRSPSTDQSLVATCISNAEQYSGTASQSQWLIDLNLELREIVMGRIAAMAFDFNFHRQVGPQGHSAFADRVVMDTFCAILSSNAVSAGPRSIRHFATEWVIPSSRNLPFLAVASVVLHLASEGMRKSAPVGTKDTLQQLSAPVMSVVLVPTLSDAVSEGTVNPNGTGSSHAESSQIAAMCISAMKRWCDATDLSLPQIRHICSKVDVNVVGVLSDAMYSDSHYVVDALAELIEGTVRRVHSSEPIPEGRMNQVRHIMQVDESSFRARFTSDQLRTIESKEMASIVDEFISAIGLQRFRFTERQQNGDHDVCRNLATIAASVCATWLDFADGAEVPRQPDHGVVSLLIMAVAHPSVNICAIALPVLARVMPIIDSLGRELLPVLQRRAITPHHSKSGVVSLVASDLCGVHFHEFQNFRKNVLRDVLLVCWRGIGDHYMDSCTSAVEEFCSDQSSGELALQLEAALFCIEIVASEALESGKPFAHSEQLKRCTEALSRKPPSLMQNAVTLSRMCSFLCQYSRWYCEDGRVGFAAEMALSVFSLSASHHPGEDSIRETLRESGISPLSEATSTLREVLSRSPKHFVHGNSLASLRAAWEASFAACAGTITIEDRIVLCEGLCHVLVALPESQRLASFGDLAAPSLDCLNRMSGLLATANSSHQSSPILSRMAEEIQMLAKMARVFTNVGSMGASSMESGCATSPDRISPIPQSVVDVVRKGWPTVSKIASDYCADENVSCAVSLFVCDLIPPSCDDENSMTLLRDLAGISSSMLKRADGQASSCDPAIAFLTQFVLQHGERVETCTVLSLGGSSVSAGDREIGRLLEDLMLRTISAVKESLGIEWTRPKEQGQGQTPFESKPPAAAVSNLASKESLTGVFSLMTQCMETCPLFLFHLPAGPGLDRDDDMLLRRAIDSALVSLNDSDQEIVLSAMKLLEAMGKQAGTQHASLRSFITDSLSRIRADAIKRLLWGCCGRYGYSVVVNAAQLLSGLLQSSQVPGEIEACLVAALRQDYFLLGDEGMNASLSVLMRFVQNQVSASYLEVFFEDVWGLHQLDETDGLPSSDVVGWFIQKYNQ